MRVLFFWWDLVKLLYKVIFLVNCFFVVVMWFLVLMLFFFRLWIIYVLGDCFLLIILLNYNFMVLFFICVFFLLNIYLLNFIFWFFVCLGFFFFNLLFVLYVKLKLVWNLWFFFCCLFFEKIRGKWEYIKLIIILNLLKNRIIDVDIISVFGFFFYCYFVVFLVFCFDIGVWICLWEFLYLGRCFLLVCKYGVWYGLFICWFWNFWMFWSIGGNSLGVFCWCRRCRWNELDWYWYMLWVIFLFWCVSDLLVVRIVCWEEEFIKIGMWFFLEFFMLY